MKTLFINGSVINVFTDTIEKTNVLVEDEKIIGIGDYSPNDADVTVDTTGRYLCPGFIDGHIHIESTQMVPGRFAEAVLPHGTTTVIADPHEIANVCGIDGIRFMLSASHGLPMSIYFMLPSCVPAVTGEESGAVLDADDLRPLYSDKRVLGLGEMMNFPGVVSGNDQVWRKIADAHAAGKLIDGHAPLLTGRDLDKYISAKIYSDHECTSAREGKEKISKGQRVMIRQGTAAKNLLDLIELFDEPWNRRCMLATDDLHPQDILSRGHIDSIIREAVTLGKSPLTAIRMATLQAAEYFGLRQLGAIAPGYQADILVLDSLDAVAVESVYVAGRKVASAGKILFDIDTETSLRQFPCCLDTFHVSPLAADDFFIRPAGEICRVIKASPGSILTEEKQLQINWAENNGVDIKRDILKLAVIERHKNTNHRGLGFVTGIGLKAGAAASSIGHDNHNISVIGTNDDDMALAANTVISMKGGEVVVKDGKVLAAQPLPIAGLMSTENVASIKDNADEINRSLAEAMGLPLNQTVMMTMSFLSLTVIPFLKMSTTGLVDVLNQKSVPLGAE